MIYITFIHIFTVFITKPKKPAKVLCVLLRELKTTNGFVFLLMHFSLLSSYKVVIFSEISYLLKYLLCHFLSATIVSYSAFYTDYYLTMRPTAFSVADCYAIDRQQCGCTAT